MRTTKTAKKHLKRMLKDKRGIDTILAALLMVVIVVVASVMVYAWSTGLLGALMVTPQVGKEAMNIENSSFSNSTFVTLYLRNTGSAAITLATYYVKDASNNQFSRTTWTTYTGIAPNALQAVNVDIGGANAAANGHCSCTLTGTSYTFTTGNAYTFVVITSRNNQFTFTVTR